MINYQFTSVFAPHILSFVKMKADLGFTTPKIEYILKELDETSVQLLLKEPIITKELIGEWRKQRLNDSERTLYDKWSILGQFARFMCHCGFPCYVPLMPRQKDKVFVPHIFSHDDMKRIFDVADSLRMHCTNHQTSLFSIPAILRTLYATGMRIGEAVSLYDSDVDFNKETILIRKSKNQRQRLIPMTANLKDILLQYKNWRDKMPIKNNGNEETTFFINQTGNPIQKGSVYTWFKKLLRMCGIPFVGGHKGPRLHDIRHTFAVHTLMKQVKAGKDIYCLLPILSTFMGHKTLAGTEYYVRLTNEMFPDLNVEIGALSSYVFPSLEKMVRENEE